MTLPNKEIFQFYEGQDRSKFHKLTGVNLNTAPNQLLENDEHQEQRLDDTNTKIDTTSDTINKRIDDEVDTLNNTINTKENTLNQTIASLDSKLDYEVLKLKNADVKYMVVSSLPTAGKDTGQYIYLVPSTNDDGFDNYNEFITTLKDGVYSWERFGNTGDIDFTPYVKRDGTADLTGNIVPNANQTLDLGSTSLKFNNVYSKNFVGNSSTSTKLATKRKINGTDFDGSNAITTTIWGTARNINIEDADGTNTSSSVSVDGSSDYTLILPSTIKATLTGNADTSTKALQDNNGNEITKTYVTLATDEIVSGAKTFSKSLTSSLTTSSYIKGNQGTAIINSTSGAGSYTMLAKMNSTNGVFTLGTYQKKYLLQYTSNDIISNSENKTSKSITLLDEDGNTTFSGNVTATKFIGDLEGSIIGSMEGPSTSCTGNSHTATTLKTPRNINGTSFDGSEDITTSLWGTSRSITIKDSDNTNSGASVSINGSQDYVINLPSTIKANIIGNCSGTAGSVAWDNVSGKPSTYTPSSHTHDDRYYTESEINTKLNGKSDTSHTHSTYLPKTAGSITLGQDGNFYPSNGVGGGLQSHYFVCWGDANKTSFYKPVEFTSDVYISGYKLTIG